MAGEGGKGAGAAAAATGGGGGGAGAGDAGAGWGSGAEADGAPAFGYPLRGPGGGTFPLDGWPQADAPSRTAPPQIQRRAMAALRFATPLLDRVTTASL